MRTRLWCRILNPVQAGRVRMWRCAACLAALLITVSDKPSSIFAAQEPPTFRSRVQAVEVDVRVTDRDGRAVRGLAREDFVILEKGAPQSIDTFSFVDLEATSPIVREKGTIIGPDVVSNAGTDRMWVVLLGFSSGNRARLIARSFVEQALGPYDEVAVVHALGNMSDAQGFTRNRKLLLDALDRVTQSPSNGGGGSEPRSVSGARGARPQDGGFSR